MEFNIKMAQQWFNDKIKDDLHSIQHKYTTIFQSIYNSYGQSLEISSCNGISFSTSELRLIFKLQQISSTLREGGDIDFILDRLIELAEALNAIEILIAECNYFFVQAYISFIRCEINNIVSREDLPYRLEGCLIALAKFSVDLADFYGDQCKGYKLGERFVNRRYIYLEKQKDNLYELLCTLADLSNVSSRKSIILGIVKPMKQRYCEIDSFHTRSDGKRINLYEYLGYLIYIQDKYPSYEGLHDVQTLIDCQTLFGQLENEINFELEYLSLPDLVKVINYDIQPIIDDAVIEELHDWDAVRDLILGSVEYEALVKEIKDEFMRDVPDYDPE